MEIPLLAGLLFVDWRSPSKLPSMIVLQAASYASYLTVRYRTEIMDLSRDTANAINISSELNINLLLTRKYCRHHFPLQRPPCVSSP